MSAPQEESCITFQGCLNFFSHSKDLNIVVPFHFHRTKLTVFCSLLEAVKDHCQIRGAVKSWNTEKHQPRPGLSVKWHPPITTPAGHSLDPTKNPGRSRQHECFQFQHRFVFSLPWEGINHSELTAPRNSAPRGTVNKEIRQIISFYENI